MTLENAHPSLLIASLRDQLLLGVPLSPLDAHRLMRLCLHPEKSIREAALLLLLEPPVDHPLDHTVRLFSIQAGGSLIPGRVPMALFELAFDLIATLRGLPETPALRASVERLLTRAPRAAAKLPCAARFSLQEMGHRIVERMFAAQCQKHGARFRSKLRLFLRLLPNAPHTWSTLTSADLTPLWENPRDHTPKRLTLGRWVRVARPLKAPEDAQDGRELRPFPTCLRPLHWGGYGHHSLRYMERLLEMQAREITAQKELCCRVSTATGRVVLSLHNASLAAMGGWGFDSVHEAVPDSFRRRAFLDGVRQEEVRIREEVFRDPEVDALQELRFDRLVRPKLTQVLLEAGVRMRLDSARFLKPDPAIQKVRRLLRDASARLSVEHARCALPGAVAPHQRLEPDSLLQWSARQGGLWRAGLARLAALLQHAQRAMTRGEIDCFVVPWIDKFYISSRRDRDGAYLPAVVRWLRAQGCCPIVLFWEDTPHAEHPSYRLALDSMIAAGLPFRGIGIFDRNGSDRGDAERIIVSSHSSTQLFALRPWTDEHFPRSFDGLLRDLDARVFRTYDSSWKDNLAFIYSGTQVSWLLSLQTSMETFSPWVVVEGRKYPFGAFLRGAIRRRILDVPAEPRSLSDPWMRHVQWAHLG